MKLQKDIGEQMAKVPEYDYQRQAWIVDGRVARCGHRIRMAGCYACAHVGELVEVPRARVELDAELERARLQLRRLREVDAHAPRVISLLFVGSAFVGAGLWRGLAGESDDEVMVRALEHVQQTSGARW